MSRLILVNWKNNSYNTILVIIEYLTKILYYKSVITTIDVTNLVKLIINIVIRHHGLSESITSNQGLIFILKFQFSLDYFLEIKQKLSTTFYLQTDSQTERQNSTIKGYFYVFVNQEQNDWIKLLSIVKFTYNNAKNKTTDHTLFQLNYDYHSYISYEDNIDFRSKSYLANELVKKLKDLILIYQ